MSETISCDLCIVGAGLAGLNALFASADYLKRGQRIVLVDRNAEPGGMWNTTYDFVRLHQPFKMFTVGNYTWDWNKPNSYFPDRAEIQGHLAQSLERLRGKLDIVELFSHELATCEETETGAVLTCAPVSGGDPVTIKASRVIQAFGSNVPDNTPLDLTSASAISVTPNTLDQALADHPGAPVYVVGGGKTGMDTILRLIDIAPNSDVTLLNGRGTVFARRDVFHPAGAKRLFGGNLFMRMAADLAGRFDGDNEEEVFDYFHKTYATSLDGRGQQYLFAFISQGEIDAIEAKLSETVYDYLKDVVGGESGLTLSLRSGDTMQAPAGSIFVNCTGSILRAPKPYQPFLSPGGKMMTVTQRSAVLFQPSVAAFMLSHMFLSGKLAKANLYELDMEDTLAKDSKLWLATSFTQSILNHLSILHAMPPHKLLKCGLDIDRWYPLPRRGLLLMHFKLNEKRYKRSAKAALERVRERAGVRVGPLR